MSFEVKIVLDSLASCGRRLTTITATYPRFIHAEIMTHRDRARNAASSRAIPWSKMRQQILENPVIPLVFGSEKKGMQTGGEVDNPDLAKKIWLDARDVALAKADALHHAGVHKSLVNRIVEPWMWITVVMSATEWANFFRLRCHPDAEIHFQTIAGMIREAMSSSVPGTPSKFHLEDVDEGWARDEFWHLPFVAHNDLGDLRKSFTLQQIKKISVARCARVSYLTHEGKRDPEKDIELFDRLVQGSGFGHWSAHEHVACASTYKDVRSGPFIGWYQYRKEFALENEIG